MEKTQIDLAKMSPDVIKQVVIKESAQSLSTLIPFFGGVGLTSFWFIFNAELLFLILGAGGVLLAPAIFMYHKMARGHIIQSKYIMSLKAEAEAQDLKKMALVAKYFESHGKQQAMMQLTKIQEKLASFENVLSSRFEKNSLNYARYFSVAEQTRHSVVYNLNEAMLKMKILSTMDKVYIRNRILEIGENKEKDDLTSTEISELASLNERLDMIKKTEHNISECISKNESAMTELDSFSMTIAELNTDNFNGDEELKLALRKISDLSNEANDNWKK